MATSIITGIYDFAKGGADKVTSSYDSYVRDKAIEEADTLIKLKGIDKEKISNDDLEAIISDLSKDIQKDHAKKAAQGLLTFIGLDFILGF